jgi:hypothetical protein
MQAEAFLIVMDLFRTGNSAGLKSTDDAHPTDIPMFPSNPQTAPIPALVE